jgi:arabinose-5-phosphate isomerase
VRPEDTVLLLSASGETEEIIRLLGPLHAQAAATLAITCRQDSTLAKRVDLALVTGEYQEACSHGLAPSTSTTLMMALGDALALVVSDGKGFTPKQFADYHPAGSLGKRLTNVQQVMRPLPQCRVAGESLSVREAIVQVSLPGRRTGAIMLINQLGQLSGIFTDSDLARLLEAGSSAGGDQNLDQPMAKVMSRNFQTVTAECYLPEAIRKLTEFKISELPVIDGHQRPLGLIDITDLLDANFLGAPPAADPKADSTPDRQVGNRDGSASRQPTTLDGRRGEPRILPMHGFVPQPSPGR